MSDQERPLTARQAQVLEEFLLLSDFHRAPPTVRELLVALKLRSSSGVQDHLLALANRGYLTHRPGKFRGWVETLKAIEWWRARSAVVFSEGRFPAPIPPPLTSSRLSRSTRHV